MRKWQIRIVEETTYRAGALLSLQGAARLFYRSSQSLRHRERLVWNNASDFLAHATRFSTLTSNRPFF